MSSVKALVFLGGGVFDLTRMIRHAGPMKLQMKWFSVLSQHL